MKKCSFVLLIFCVAMICAPIMAVAAPSPEPSISLSPASTAVLSPEPPAAPSPGPSPRPSPGPSPKPTATPSPEPPPTPTPTLNVAELLKTAELPEYGILKEGDSGDGVLLLQQRLRDLGYFTYKETGEFGGQTLDAVKRFQKQNDIPDDGVVGGKTNLLLFTNYAKRAAISNPRIPTPKPPPKPKPKLYGKLLDWKKVFAMIKRGEAFKVMDFYTQKTYTMVYIGGHNHMDVEPRTKADNTVFKNTYGGVWSWARRPVLVRIHGTWYAASTNGMPHGYEVSKTNGMVGQVCIHFLNSRTHATNAVDAEHQRCVRIAAGK